MKRVLRPLLIACIILAGCDTIEQTEFDLREVQFETRELAQEALPDPDTGKVLKSAHIEYQFASSGPLHIQDSINHHIEQQILCRRLYCENDFTYERFLASFLPDSSQRTSSVFYFSAENTVYAQTQNMISFETKLGVYAGGASGNGISSKHYTHLDREGRQIQLDRIVSDQDELYKIAKENFLPATSGVYPERFFIPPDWYIKEYPNGASVLVFYYQAYDVGPGVLGSVVFDLPKDLIKHIVIEDYWP